MKYCLYCAQTQTRLDEFGYCKKYDCFEKSGKKQILKDLIKRVGNIYRLPKSSTLGIRSYVTNYYNPRDREVNDIIYVAQKEFGLVPEELLKTIPAENMKKWDRNIKW